MSAVSEVLNVLIEDQAFLWAEVQKIRTLHLGHEVTEEMFISWQNQWLAETKAKLQERFSDDTDIEL